MLTIGLNAKILTSPGTNGIKRYLLQMLKQLSKRDIQIVLFTPVCIDQQSLGIDKPNIKQVLPSRSFGNSLLSKVMWQFYYLPRLLCKTAIDIFWGPNHNLPLVCPKRVKTVVTIHDLVWLDHRNTMRFTNWLSNLINVPSAVRKADLICAVSEFTAQQLGEAYPKVKDKIAVVPNAAYDVVNEAPKADQPNDQGVTSGHIMMLGTFEPRKNHQRFLAAYSRLPIELKATHPLVIAGSPGWGKVDLPALVTTYGLTQYVTLLQAQSDACIQAWLKQARFLALPSLYEGFGLPIVEAHRFGVPVLTANNSSMVEVGGEGAIFVDPYSVDDIYQGILRLVSDDDLCQQLKIGALNNVQRYSWDKSSAQMFTLMQCVVGK